MGILTVWPCVPVFWVKLTVKNTPQTVWRNRTALFRQISSDNFSATDTNTELRRGLSLFGGHLNYGRR
jgi:hypothetical protein